MLAVEIAWSAASLTVETFFSGEFNQCRSSKAILPMRIFRRTYEITSKRPSRLRGEVKLVSPRLCARSERWWSYLECTLRRSVYCVWSLPTPGRCHQRLCASGWKGPLRNQKLRSLLLDKVLRSCVQLAFVLVRSAWSIFFVYSLKSGALGAWKQADASDLAQMSALLSDLSFCQFENSDYHPKDHEIQ